MHWFAYSKIDSLSIKILMQPIVGGEYLLYLKCSKWLPTEDSWLRPFFFFYLYFHLKSLWNGRINIKINPQQHWKPRRLDSTLRKFLIIYNRWNKIEDTAQLCKRPQNTIKVKDSELSRTMKNPQDHKQGKLGTNPGAVSRVTN